VGVEIASFLGGDLAGPGWWMTFDGGANYSTGRECQGFRRGAGGTREQRNINPTVRRAIDCTAKQSEEGLDEIGVIKGFL
jgi:hypothetical protein